MSIIFFIFLLFKIFIDYSLYKLVFSHKQSLSRCHLDFTFSFPVSPLVGRDARTVDRANEGSAAKIGKETFALFSSDVRSGAEEGRAESVKIVQSTKIGEEMRKIASVVCNHAVGERNCRRL